MSIDTEELIERLKNEDVRSIAESMGIHVLALAVICKDHGIPWPGIRSDHAGTQPKDRVRSCLSADAEEPMQQRESSLDEPARKVRNTPAKSIPVASSPSGHSSERVVVLSRAELYDLIWTYPILQLSRAWGLSDVGLAKICRKHDIPRPGKGYWAKLQNGYRMKRVPLRRPREKTEIRIHCGLPYQPPTVDDQQASSAQALRHAAGKIRVSTVLADPHPIVERTMSSFQTSGSDHIGVIRPRASGTFSLAVSARKADRAALIMDGLIKEMERRGLQLKFKASVIELEYSRFLRSSREWVTKRKKAKLSISYVEVLGESIALGLEEKLRYRRNDERDDHLSPSLYRPSGILRLWLEDLASPPMAGKSWGDSKTRTLEKCIAAVVRGLFDLAVEVRSRRLERERLERERQERERQAAELAKQQREEEGRQKQIWLDIEKWQKATQIRTFLEDVRKRAVADRGEIVPGSEVAMFLDWGERLAQTYDPITNGAPSFTGYGAEHTRWW